MQEAFVGCQRTYGGRAGFAEDESAELGEPV